jgi:hypothetical protein
MTAGDSYALALSSIMSAPALRLEVLRQNCKDLQQFEQLSRCLAEVEYRLMLSRRRLGLPEACLSG